MMEPQDTDETIKTWKIKNLIKSLESARGNGTSMISLIMPPGDQISRVTKMLNDEYGTASNIKSRVNRQSVLGAITSAKQRLKLYNKVPANGLVLYTGTVVTEDCKEKKITVDFEPFRAINVSLYLCDNKFHIEALNALLESGDKFGFIIMDGNGTLFGTVCGNTREVVHKFSVDLPKKHGRGGQSALRFGRLRMEKRHNYVRKVAELATQFYINPSTSQPNVSGLILAGSADFKTELSHSKMFDPRLQATIFNVVDVSYGGEDGFNQAINLSAEILSNVRFMQVKHLLGKYFEQLNQDTHKVVNGLNDTLKALALGAVDKLIVWENLDIVRYTLQNVTTGEVIIKHLNKCQEGDQEDLRDLNTNAELEVEERMPLLEWFANNYKKFGCMLEFVTDKSREGNMFCKGFGGIGGILRYQLDIRLFDEASDDDVSNDDVSDDEVPDDEASDDEAPDAEAPDAEASDDEASDDEASDAEAPDAEASDDEASDDDVSDAEASNAEAYDDDVSDAEAFDDDVSDAEASNAEASDDDVSDAEAPDDDESNDDVSDAEAPDDDESNDDVSDAEVSEDSE